MKSPEFREVQVSSTLLVVIFLGVLALNVFVFLLGVSVGKKQVQVSSRTQVVTQPITETAKEPAVKPPGAEQESAKSELSAPGGEIAAKASEAPAKTPAKAPSSSTAPEKTKSEAKKAPAPGSGLYYVQVGAFTDRSQAQALADRYKKQGYTAVVAEPRPTDTRAQYRVRLGGFSSRDRAADLLKKLNAAAGRKTDFYVVRD